MPFDPAHPSSKEIAIDEYSVETDGEVLAAFSATPAHDQSRMCVILHGAGEATKERSIPLARALANEGVGAIGFDFAGHGQSTGRIEQMTLRRRTAQAAAVIEDLGPVAALGVCGFSMSGETVCDLLALGLKPQVVALFAPALYSAGAQEKKFGPEFSAAIREPKNWQESAGLSAIRDFDGALLVYTSPDDDVIPNEVPELLVREAAMAPVAEQVVLQGAPHQLSEWLGDNPREAASVAQRIAALIQGESSRDGA